jgi:hypothetical protein
VAAAFGRPEVGSPGSGAFIEEDTIPDDGLPISREAGKIRFAIEDLPDAVRDGMGVF